MNKSTHCYDMIIIGAGPSGFTAAFIRMNFFQRRLRKGLQFKITVGIAANQVCINSGFFVLTA